MSLDLLPRSISQFDILAFWVYSLPGAVILKLSHGYSIKHEGNDPLVDLAEHVLGTVISESIQAGKWLVDNVRFCAYLSCTV